MKLVQCSYGRAIAREEPAMSNVALEFLGRKSDGIKHDKTGIHNT